MVYNISIRYLVNQPISFGTFYVPNNNSGIEFTVKNNTEFVTLLDFTF